MHLGFHYHIPAFFSEEAIYITGHLGRFIDSLAQHFETVTCFLHSPLPQELYLADYKIKSSNVELVNLGSHSSVPKRIFTIPLVNKKIRHNRKRIDCMLIRGPSPLLPDIARACGLLPIALLLVGDQLAGIDDLPQAPIRKEFIRLFWKWNIHRQERIAKNNLTFVNSHMLFNQLSKKVPNLIETRTTTLNETDFFIREDTCLKPPYHVLYTGRMDRTKGILESVDSIAILVKEGVDIIFDLVGPEDKADEVLLVARKKAEQLGIANRIVFHGYKQVGPELFQFYKNSDIFLIASQASEGFPRTIWEAMAHSLPVVSTRVGSIPYYVKDCAKFIEPRNPHSIASAIKSLLNDPKRRQRMIKTGRELAHENTLEKRSLEMATILKEYIKKVSR